MSIVYLSKLAVNGLFSTAAYLARSISNYTVASPGDLAIFGKPSINQIAYDGYTANIEAFIHATCIQKKVYCDRPHYPIDPSHTVTVPIQLPRTVFALVNKPSSEGEKKMMDAGKEFGIEKRLVGKGHVYTVEKPTIEFIRKVEKIAQPQCTNITDYSQVRATVHFYWITQCVDLFLATNTYSFKPETYSQEKIAAGAEVPKGNLAYRGTAHWEGGCSKTVSVKTRNITGSWEDRQIVNPDEEHEYDSGVYPQSAVYIAKPSPLPASTSFGLPAACPNSKGLHFPYFEGMHHSDVKFTRDIISRLFFRNLGSVAKGPREAYKEIRTEIGPAVTTPECRILNHILYGIDLALGTQTQLFLLYDNGHYYGFNLLGGYFSIWTGQWIDPVDEAELQATMLRYRSHEASLTDLYRYMKTEAITYVPEYKPKFKTLETSQQVAELLGHVDQSVTHANTLEKIEELVGNLVFTGVYRRMNADNLEASIDELLGNSTIAKDLLVYIPKARSGWKSIASPYYAPIGAFGARSFSLIDRGGKANEVVLSSDVFVTKLEEGDKETKKRTSLPFFEKPYHECVADWAKVVQTGKAKVNFQERAIGSRGFLVKGDALESIVGIFEKAREDKRIAIGIPKVEKQRKDRGGDTDMGGEVVNIEDVF